MELLELIQNYITAHNKVTTDRKEEDEYLDGIIDILQATYPDRKVKYIDGYISIAYFTVISYEDIKPLLDFGLTNFTIDTHLQVERHYLRIPQYYNNLQIYLDVDKLKDLIGEP